MMTIMLNDAAAIMAEPDASILAAMISLRMLTTRWLWCHTLDNPRNAQD